MRGLTLIPATTVILSDYRDQREAHEPRGFSRREQHFRQMNTGSTSPVSAAAIAPAKRSISLSLRCNVGHWNRRSTHCDLTGPAWRSGRARSVYPTTPKRFFSVMPILMKRSSSIECSGSGASKASGSRKIVAPSESDRPCLTWFLRSLFGSNVNFRILQRLPRLGKCWKPQ